MALNESDTRAKLIDPALHARAWTDLIRREETAGAIEIVDGRARRRGKRRCDYTLRVKVEAGVQPVAVALIEAKAESLPPTHGLEQAKLYAAPTVSTFHSCSPPTAICTWSSTDARASRPRRDRCRFSPGRRN
ncbi:MAG TPA: hypothetical protein VED01_00425 [Burkholderiales bacterium]|nr:hypothetical protein [Burkholderiales bacterium]